ncbi:MAG: MazG family protein, partial [Chloroflexota bacterium]
HSQMAAEEGLFNLSDVISGIHAKIIRRHPHVWGPVAVDGADQVVLNWEQIKAKEKAEKGNPDPESILDGLPMTLSALAKSQKIQKKVRKVGFDWQNIAGVYDKLQEEISEIKAAKSSAEQLEEVGDLLFVTVNLAKWLGVDAEIALREANLKFERRFRVMESIAKDQGLQLTGLTEDALDRLWNQAKEISI